MVEKPSHNLHNYILRHACKKNVFRFSEPFFARLASKFEKSTNMTLKGQCHEIFDFWFFS